MRQWIVLFEASSPDWFAMGDPIRIEDWDVGEYLEGDEFDLEWRFCQVPCDLVQPNLLDPVVSGPRIDEIEAWLADGGSVDAQPCIAIWNGKKFTLLDGNHRAQVLKSRGKTIPMLVAINYDFSGWGS